jgi:hypothetical protein
MLKQDRLAALINHMSENELLNITPQGAIAIIEALRLQPRNQETKTALRRVALRLLCDDNGENDGDSPPFRTMQ